MHKMSSALHATPAQPLTTRASVSLTTVSIHSAEQGRDFPAHQHNAWELVYYLGGSIKCVVGGRVLEMRHGTRYRAANGSLRPGAQRLPADLCTFAVASRRAGCRCKTTNRTIPQRCLRGWCGNGVGRAPTGRRC